MDVTPLLVLGFVAMFGFIMFVAGWAAGQEILSRRAMKNLIAYSGLEDEVMFTLDELTVIKSALRTP